jgi:hypothetical protein
MNLTCGEIVLKEAIAKMGDPHRRLIIGRVRSSPSRFTSERRISGRLPLLRAL